MKIHPLLKFFILFFLISNSSYVSADRIPAFPGAEGHGMYTRGGRGGRVIKVTNLNDSGEGSFRAAVEAEGPRIVVFEVSGTIALKSRITVRNPYITIAGQTAPGDGICIKNYCFDFHGCGEAIMRYMRFRMGDETKNQDDALGGQKNKNLIIDHCSVSWSTDECASFYANENFTLQWCLITESLCRSIHVGGRHGFGGVWGGTKASFHHNLLSNHTSRNPRLGEYCSTYALHDLVDVRNNVVYNHGYNTGYGGEGMHANFVNNYYKPGPATERCLDRIYSPNCRVETWDILYGVWGQYYVNGNVLEGSAKTTQDNWTYGVANQIGSEYTNLTPEVMDQMRLKEPLDPGYVTTHTAREAFDIVLKNAGANIHRDAVDLRAVHDAATGTVTFTDGGNGSTNGIIDTQKAVGGWPELKSLPAPLDSDDDGMPDEWEIKNGLNPQDPTDGNLDRNHDGYTNIEEYLNSLVPVEYDTKPIASLSYPSDNEVFLTKNKTSIDIKAFANDYNGGSISKLQIVFDNQLVCEGENVGQLNTRVKRVSHGMHQIIVKCVDNTGNTSNDTTHVYVGTRKVHVNVDERARNGKVLLDPPGGVYTEGVNVRLKAIPDDLYHFYGWTNDLEGRQESELNICTDQDMSVKPVFVCDNDPMELYRNPIRINFGPLNGFYAPKGFMPDGGTMYTTKLNGLRYGWLDGYNLCGTQDKSEQNILWATHNTFTTDSTSHCWGIYLPKGFYRVKVGLGAKKEQKALRLNFGLQRCDIPQLVYNEPISEDTRKEVVFDKVEVKDGSSYMPDVEMILSSANQTEIYYIEIEPVRLGGNRKLRVINGDGSGIFPSIHHDVLIQADAPAEGMVFDKWVSDREPQYFEEQDVRLPIQEYVEDIYSPTTFVTKIDYYTCIRATYKKK